MTEIHRLTVSDGRPEKKATTRAERSQPKGRRCVGYPGWAARALEQEITALELEITAAQDDGV